MSRRSVGVIAAARVAPPVSGNNNAPEFLMWGGYPVGDPHNSNGNLSGITPAKHTEWGTQRMVAGGGWITVIQRLESMGGISTGWDGTSGADRYNGGIASQPETAGYSWSREALEARGDGLNWFQRSATFGQRNWTGIYASNAYTAWQTTPFFPWNDNGAWNVLLPDFTVYVQTAYAAGFTGIAFDGELYSYPNQNVWGWGSASEVKARGQQMAQIIATYMPVAGGPEIGFYPSVITGGWYELVQHVQNGAPVHSFVGNRQDAFIAGCCTVSGVRGVHLLDPVFYRDTSQLGNDAADNGVTRYANAYSFDLGGLMAQMSTQFTDAERLAAMRRFYIHGFLWPSRGQPSAEQGPVSASQYQAMTKAAVKWSMDGFHVVYVQDLDDSAALGRDHNVWEAGWQAECIDGVADSTPPVCSITSPTSNATFATAASTLVLAGTASDDQAIWRVEWANAANSTSGSATLVWVNDTGSNWDPLNASKLPQNTALGRILWHDNWTTQAIALVVGANVITVTAYDTHNNSHSDTLTVTRS